MSFACIKEQAAPLDGYINEVLQAVSQG
jgi:hypothetical protein